MDVLLPVPVAPSQASPAHQLAQQVSTLKLPAPIGELAANHDVRGRTIGLTESFRLTTMFLIGAIIMLALEYRNMEARQRGYYECKDRGISMHGCNDEVGVKWRAERNFWMVGFNLLCWLMVDRLSERIKMEETYQGDTPRAPCSLAVDLSTAPALRLHCC